jgi:hypothetical protein
VPFSRAEWSLAYILHAKICEAGFTGQFWQFFWVGQDSGYISQRMVEFLREQMQE